MSHLQLSWPLCVPVHDALRDAFRGLAVLPGGAVVRLESDSVHSSSLVGGLADPPAQLDFFAKRLQAHSPAAAALFAALAADGEHAEAGGSAGWPGLITPGGMEVCCATRRSYRVPSPAPSSDAESRDEFELVTDTWDEDATWRPWAAQDDPLGECSASFLSFCFALL